MRMQDGQLAGWGFHAGELAVQERVSAIQPPLSDPEACARSTRWA